MVTFKELLERRRASRASRYQELAKPFDGRTIVLSHNAPLMRSFDPNLISEITKAAFARDLSDLIERRQPSLWIHCLTHK